MDAKEKAKELIIKFTPYMYCYMGSGMLSNSYDEKIVLDNAKECAIISVDEIINVGNGFMTFGVGEPYKSISTKQYWEEVKTHIQSS